LQVRWDSSNHWATVEDTTIDFTKY
jgi:hypothetical protein